MKRNFTVLLILFTSMLGFAQIKPVQTDTDRFEVTVCDCADSIRILQFTDMHLGHTERWKKDLVTFQRVRKLVEMYDPHIIALTGDIMTGWENEGHLMVSSVVNVFDAFERPWLFIYGNHDPEGGFGRDSIAQVFECSQWGMLGYHGNGDSKKYDYVIEVKSGDKTAWQLWNFDSGSQKGFKSIKADQLDWYRDMSKKYDDPAIAFFHIPLKQYQDLWNDTSIPKQGESKEKVYYEEDDGSVYDAFVEVGNIRATFCGHDHYNSYWGEYTGGIILAYGYITGESTKWAWPTGGKLITLPAKGGEIGIRNVVPVFE